MAAYDDLLQPRFVLSVLGLIVVAALTVNETVSPEIGITVLVGILAANGVYTKYKRDDSGL